MVFYLIYVSTATKLIPEQELFELLKQSREKNKRLGITGVLLYKSGNFAQMLEGEELAVRELYNTICNDERHYDVYTVITDHINERNYADWSVGFVYMNKVAGPQAYQDFIDDFLLKNQFEADSQIAYRFLCSFDEYMR